MPQEVMLYHSGQVGAPGANLAIAGGMSGLLDACLVNGFNVQGVATLTRSGTTATATTSGTHGFAVGEWVDVAGADQAAYNGRVKVTAAPAVNQFTYEVTGSPATPATGTITARYGPAGWSKPHSGTNGGVYVTGAGSLGHAMQVEDGNPYSDGNASCRTRIVTVPTGFPDSGDDLGEQCRMNKSGSGWVLVADPRSCYVIIGAAMTFCFGEFASLLSGDTFAFFQNRGRNADAAGWAVVEDGTAGAASISVNPGVWFPRATVSAQGQTNTLGATIIRGASQLFGTVYAHPLNTSVKPSSLSSSSSNYGNAVLRRQDVVFPNLADNSMPLLPEFLVEVVSGLSTLRGRLRGVYFPLSKADGGSFVNNVLRLDDVVINGTLRKIALCRYANGGQIAFDMGETWS